MYMPDAWGVVYKIDVRSGTSGRIVWKMDPAQEKIDRNRGVALWGNLVISVTSRDGRVIATDKETGKIVWDKNLRDQPDMTLNAGAAGAQGLDPRRRLGRRPGRAQLARRARPQDRQRTVADLFRSRRPASPAARPGRTRTTPGRPAAAPSTSPAPTIPPPTSPIGAPATRRRNTIHPTGRATTSTPTARSPSMPRPARSSGTTSTRRTTRWTTTRPAPTS